MAIANITNNILTDSGVSTSSLLPLTGGALTGALTITSAATYALDVTGTGRFTGTVGIGITNTSNQLEVLGTANNWGTAINGSTTTGQSYGAIVRAGTNSSDVAFRVNNAANNTTYFTVNGSGNVGIGTSSPTTFSGNTTLAINNSAGGAVLELQSNGTSAFRMATSSSDSALWEPRSVPVLFATANTERMRITSGGQLQVRNDAVFGLDYNATQYIAISENQIRRIGNGTLFINNSNTGDVSININGGGTFVNGTNGYGRAVTNSSDERIKKNIVKIENALDKVIDMNGVYYEFDTNNSLGVSVPSGSKRVGLIAQQIEGILPEAVFNSDKENEPKSIDYSGMVGLLINAIQELKAERDTDKKEIELLKAQFGSN